MSPPRYPRAPCPKQARAAAVEDQDIARGGVRFARWVLGFSVLVDPSTISAAIFCFVLSLLLCIFQIRTRILTLVFLTFLSLEGHRLVFILPNSHRLGKKGRARGQVKRTSRVNKQSFEGRSWCRSPLRLLAINACVAPAHRTFSAKNVQ